MSDWIDVAPASAVPPGTWRSADVDGTDVAVFNLDGAYYAIENVCTHDGGILTGGAIDGDVIVCPRHGARFCIRTGEVLSPRTRTSRRFPSASRPAACRCATPAGNDGSAHQPAGSFVRARWPS